MTSADHRDRVLIGAGQPSHERGRRARRPGAGRPTHLWLARIHLRTGSYGLARAELETAAGLGDLDDEGLLDLAEIRWRTGDLSGAGDAADAYLAAGGADVLGFVIAAEAMAALGRPGEARRLARSALDRTNEPLDALFAGISRSGVWPHDPLAPGEPVGTLFPVGPGSTAQRPGVFSTPSAASAVTRGGSLDEAARADAASPAEPGFWDDHGDVDQSAVVAAPDPGTELAVARAAIAAGQRSAGAIHLAIALRLDPGLAPAVLELAADQPGPIFDLLRGDAYHLAGNEPSARRAYAAAASALPTTVDQGDVAKSVGAHQPVIKEES